VFRRLIGGDQGAVFHGLQPPDRRTAQLDLPVRLGREPRIRSELLGCRVWHDSSLPWTQARCSRHRA
jgi:hypothetical protein